MTWLARHAPRLLFGLGLLLILTGVTQILLSDSLPAYTDASAVKNMQVEQPPDGAVAREAFLADWHERRLQLEGGRYVAFDKGTSDLTLGLLLILVAACLPAAARTYGKLRLGLEAAVGLTAAAAFAGSAAYGALLDQERGRLNFSADSISLPIFDAGLMLAMLLVSVGVIVLAVGPILRRNKSRLWPDAPTTRERAIVSSLIFLPLFGLSAVGLFAGRSFSASWVTAVSVSATIIVILSWYQSALTPPGTVKART